MTNTVLSKTVLITGGRAPAALELVRVFADAGYRVVIAESQVWNLSRFSNKVDKSYTIAPPRQDFDTFAKQLLEIVQKEVIDLFIPTCEEVFYVSMCKDYILEHMPSCDVFCGSIEQLRSFHDKWSFVQLAKAYDLAVPETVLLTSIGDVDAYWQREDVVIKRCYSRFASDCLLPPFDRFTQPVPTGEQVWIAQELIQGRHYCSYSVVRDGVVQAHTAYAIEWKAGGGSSLTFKHLQHARISQWVERFASCSNYTGQLAFDFIESSEGLFAIECNPRATSGVHNLANIAGFADSFFDTKLDLNSLDLNNRPTSMIAAAMLVYAFPKALKDGNILEWFKCMTKSRDVIFSTKDPLPLVLSAIPFTTLTLRALQKGISSLEASTWDIEWNGESYSLPDTEF